ncbi:hypothetical protein UAY_00883 [Enterococcus moraviensis ATCC BAA-383]|uniref:Uncharacterized protein n=1 Tax=Enterococcus moraviensis ATCC BAA-383 TaxID=1158609 RepID=R2R5N8_9ENTE|nr:hypothetical protein [Enterococcus moraviensis]EOI03136.1 hypothetical protein UAY_00883 [Enterococcus moraviensis ATCC BAA-383]EOT73987.1 hypothetical protein I586_00983 [Enterococcus moraviensis ATCC BAA-383]
MNNERMIAKYFKENFPTKQLRYEMYLDHNKYLKIPELVFRFQDNVDSVAYDELKRCVESFSGKLEWTVIKGFFGRKNINYSLSPKVMYQYYKDQFDKEEFPSQEEYFLEETFRKICEDAIEDIPALYKYIKNNFAWKDEYQKRISE